jgi:hypothetical protein
LEAKEAGSPEKQQEGGGTIVKAIRNGHSRTFEGKEVKTK